MENIKNCQEQYVKITQLTEDMRQMKSDVIALKIEEERQRVEINALEKNATDFNAHLRTAEVVTKEIKHIHDSLAKMDAEIKAISNKILDMGQIISANTAILQELPSKYKQIQKPMTMKEMISMTPALITLCTAIIIIIYYAMKHLGLGG